MKKVLLLFSILFFAQAESIIAQLNSATDHKKTYEELKQEGLLNNYTPEQLTQMLKDEEGETPKTFPQPELQQTRSNDPPAPSIQTTSNAFAITPSNPSICSGQALTLTASNSYTYSTTGLYIADDRWSSIINLPFSFTFYGINYNNLIISTNGSIGFNTFYANWFSSWWTWIANQPTTFVGDEENTINSPWIDLYIPAGGTMRYATVGTAPNRIFVIEYCNVNYWGCFSSPSSTLTGQTLLYEGSNIIETHIFNKPLWSCVYYWPVNYAIHSTQNSAGSVAAVVPGRNATNYGWTAFSEGKRWTWNNSTNNYDISTITFSPAGIFNASTINWYDASNTLVGTGSTFTVPGSLPTGVYVYHAQISVDWCSGTINYTAYDTVNVTSNLSAPTASSVTICPNTTTMLSASCGGNCLWYTGSSGGSPIGTGYYTTPALSSSTTYYVGYTSGSCASPRTAVTVNVGATLAVPTATATSVCSSSVASTLTGNCGSNCQWYSDTTSTPIGTGSTFTTTPPTTTYYVHTFSGGCTSNFTTVTVPIGNLAVTSTPATSLTSCPTSSSPVGITTSYSGAYAVNSTVSNTTSSTTIPNQTTSNYCTSTDPSNTTSCPSSAYKTRSILSPSGVSNPMTSSSIVSVYFKLSDITLTNYLGQPTAVGADPKVWLKSPAATYLLLTSPRSLNTDYASASGNYCYCPTFTPAGTDGLLPNYDTAYNWTNYAPEGGALGSAFVGINPYATNNGPSGTWTLIVNDNVDTGGLSTGSLRIREFKMTFATYPTVTYNWISSGTCLGSLSSTTTANPSYQPPSPYDTAVSCTYTVTVTSGTCSGTATVNAICYALPIELIGFSGKNTEGGNLLTWTTATETNNAYFTLDRVNSNQEIETSWKILSGAANGNSSQSIDYSLLDKNVKPGVYFYHLSQTDIDGTRHELGTVAISVKSHVSEITLIPNPAKDKVEVVYHCISNAQSHLKLYDYAGNEIMEKEITCTEGENKYILDLTYLPDGMYLVTISSGQTISKAKFAKSN